MNRMVILIVVGVIAVGVRLSANFFFSSADLSQSKNEEQKLNILFWTHQNPSLREESPLSFTVDSVMAQWGRAMVPWLLEVGHHQI